MLIRFVSRFTVHLYNAIYFSTTFSIPCKRFIKILRFVFTPSKHSLKRAIGQEMSTHDLFSIYRWQQFLFRLPCIDLICELGYMMEREINGAFGLLTNILFALCISSL